MSHSDTISRYSVRNMTPGGRKPKSAKKLSYRFKSDDNTHPTKKQKFTDTNAVLKSAEDLNSVTNSTGNYSVDLLPPGTPQRDGGNRVSTTPTGAVIHVQNSETSLTVPGTEATVETELATKDQLLMKLKEDIESALVFSTALKDKLTAIHDTFRLKKKLNHLQVRCQGRYTMSRRLQERE